MHGTTQRLSHDQLAAFNHCRVAIRQQMRALDVERMSSLLHIDAFERELEFEFTALKFAVIARALEARGLVGQNRKLRRHFRGSLPDLESQAEIRYLQGVVRNLQRALSIARDNVALVDEYWTILNQNHAALILQAFTRRCLRRRRVRQQLRRRREQQEAQMPLASPASEN